MSLRRRDMGALLGAGLLGSAAGLAGCGGGQADRAPARLRLLNLTNGYPGLDLYVKDAKAASAVAIGAASPYINASSEGTVDTQLTSTGQTTVLLTTSRTWEAEQRYTVVAYGWAGSLRTTILQENLAAADSGRARLQLLNLAPDAGALDVYLTGSGESLDGATAVFAGVAAANTPAPVSHATGTFRLRVTAAGDKNDLRLDVSGLVLSSTQVATLLVTPGTGGFLVNARLLTQHGDVAGLTNSRARVRVVASVSGNGRVTASVNGSTVTAALTSPGIGSYQGVAAGSALPVQLVLDGTAVPVAAQDLEAGGDYTLLVWGSAAAPQVQWVSEDNRLPAAATAARLRVWHALNGLATGVTLAVDFSAVATNVQPGAVSDWASVTAAASMRLEVLSALSSTPVYSATDVAIAARGLYTVYLLGDSAAPNTALRRER